MLLEGPRLAGARLCVCRRLLRTGIQPRLKQDAGPEKFPYVLFSAPPSGSDDYPGEVSIQCCRVLPTQQYCLACCLLLQQGSMPSSTAVQVAKAVDLWDGSGGFVFTSSAGLYTVEDGSHCNEDSPTAKIGSSDRTDRCAILRLRTCIFARS